MTTDPPTDPTNQQQAPQVPNTNSKPPSTTTPKKSKKRKRDETDSTSTNANNSSTTITTKSGPKKTKSSPAAKPRKKPSHSSSSAASSEELKANIKRTQERHASSALVQQSLDRINQIHRDLERFDSALFYNNGAAERVFDMENSGGLNWCHFPVYKASQMQQSSQANSSNATPSSSTSGHDGSSALASPTSTIQQPPSTPQQPLYYTEPVKTHEINSTIPTDLLQDPSLLKEIFTNATLKDKLNEEEKKFLSRFLPSDMSVYSVFDKCSRFGQNQVDGFVENLSNGEFHPLIYQQKMHLKFLRNQRNALHKAMVENYIKAQIHQNHGEPTENELDNVMTDDD